MQIRIIFALPSLVPRPLVPWAAAPVAYPSIHHCVRDLRTMKRSILRDLRH